MLYALQSLDASILLWINGLHNSACDFFFWWVSDRAIWIPFYLYLAYLVYRKHPHRYISIFIFIAITIAFTDQLTSTILKNSVGRLRPCHDPLLAGKIHLVNNDCGGKYGFASGHAANSFALFMFLSLLFGKENKKLVRIIFWWAVVVSFSRIYLGKHFPSDIICGALIGCIIAAAMYRTHRFYLSNFAPVHIKKRRNHSSKENHHHSI
jgi:undecaprenyl-diphosphatase